MHTHWSQRFAKSVVSFIFWGLLVVLGAAMPGSSLAQAEFPGAPDDPSLNLRLYPLDTWSPRTGLGVGLGLVAHHLGRQGAQGLFTVAPARHEQVATLTWASANPDRARRYTLLSARGLHTDRDWFFGLGPRSMKNARQSVERSSAQLRARVGQHFLSRQLLVHPHLDLAFHRVDRVPAREMPGLAGRSERHLKQLSSSQTGPLSPRQTLVRAGVDLQFDSRPSGDRRTRGLLFNASWHRAIGLSSFLTYDRIYFGGSGILPLGNSHSVVGHVSWTRAVSRGQTPVPYYLRPTLGGRQVPGWARHRFVDSDRLRASALYRFPIARPWNALRIDGHLGAHVGNVYSNVFTDASLDVSFAEFLDARGDRIPLRPSGSVGLHLGLGFRPAPTLDVALGMSPEGISAVRFALTQDLTDLRPPHHRIRR